MESHVHKLLLTNGMFSKDCDEEYRDIVKASSGDGYAALHNILRSHHPRLTDKKVETNIPAQSIGTRFGHHVRAVQDHLFREETRGRIYSKYEALQLVIDTLHPSYHLNQKFRTEKEFHQKHDLEDSIPFKLQMSQLGITLTSWSSEMRLSEKKAPRFLHIHHQGSNDDDSLGDPGIFALSEDLKCSLCGRSGHENTSCHKLMNHVIDEALMKSHPKEAARIMRENKQFVTVGPRGTPRQNVERTECRPPSAIRMVAHSLSPEDTVAVVNIKTPSDAHDESIDKVIQITRVGVDDYGSVSSEESVGNLDYGPTARIAMCQDVSTVVRYDEQLIDRINANWDEELTKTQVLGTWSTDVASKEPLYEEHASTQNTVEFYDAWENPQGKDTPTTEQS
jgi:hypothetical protein